MPFPLIVTTSRIKEAQQLVDNSTTVIPLSNTQFEITPYSFGSFDATLSARVPIEYLGTAMSNGAVTNTCVNYFEAASFVMGSSASLFNSIQEDPRVSMVRTP
jgi:lysophospholipase